MLKSIDCKATVFANGYHKKCVRFFYLYLIKEKVVENKVKINIKLFFFSAMR